MQAFGASRQWPVDHRAVAVLHQGELLGLDGDVDHRFRWASVTKLLTAWAAHIAVEEGSITLDDPVGQPGCTVRDLLCHAGGYAFEGLVPVSTPRRTRIYSNTGYELLAHHIASRTGIPFATYLDEAVLAPLGMTTCHLDGSAAKDAVGTIGDLLRFAGELSQPHLIAPETAHAATSVVYPLLSGVVPAVGRFDPCPWGLGPEIKGAKSPHWMGSRTSPRTFGHFGGTGTFIWVDPTLDAACLALTDREVTSWAMTHWPVFADAVVDELAVGRGRST